MYVPELLPFVIAFLIQLNVFLSYHPSKFYKQLVYLMPLFSVAPSVGSIVLSYNLLWFLSAVYFLQLLLLITCTCFIFYVACIHHIYT